MVDTKDRLRAEPQPLIDALRELGVSVRGKSAFKCPFHDDKTPSAGIYEKDGVWRMKCQAACCGFNGDVFDVREKSRGKSVMDQLSEIRQADKPVPVRSWPTPKAWAASFDHVSDVYVYTNPDTGRIDLLKLRRDLPGGSKTFFQASVGADGRVYGKAPPKPWPLANRTAVKASSQVVVVEGEKCVKALASVGVAATCAPTGGREGGAADCDWSPLAGKTVIFWPDHDPEDGEGVRGGHRHMREVIEQCKALNPPCSMWWLDPAKLGLGDKEDVADYLARFDEGKADAISDALDLVVPVDSASGLRGFLDEIIAGKWASEPIPSMPAISALCRPLLPGCVWVIVGDPGSTKSFLLMQIVRELALVNGISTAAFMLEDDVNFHLLRALAQLDENEKLTDDVWIREHVEETNAAYARHHGALAQLGRIVFDAPDRELTYDEILAWIQQRAESGVRVIAVDPITAINAGAKPWDSDKAFMARVKGILRKHRASLILITHPRSANTKGTADDAAGSRAFGRFAQCVTWMRPHIDGLCVEIETREHGIRRVHTLTIDREMRVPKARNGKGQGLSIGLQFNGQTLCFEERGVIVRTLKKDDEGAI